MSAASGTSNPEYVVARVRARKAQLFDDDDYRKLVRMGPAEIARQMEESVYEDEINALGARHAGVDLIEYALNRDLAGQFEDILRWAGGRLYDLVARYLRKFDAWNLKTVIRGIYSDTDRDTVEADLIRAGELADRLVDTLLDATSVEEAVVALEGTRYGDPLAAAFDDYEESGVLVPLENAVDRAYYDQLLEDLAVDETTAVYREFLTAEIDFRNARNALRLAGSGAGVDPADYFIEGGRLFSASELSTLAGSREELVARIRSSTYGDELDEALDALAESESLIGFERALDAALGSYADQLGFVNPLSVTPVVSFIIAKEREVDNIRAIARGREAGLGPERIESELVVL
ncbi:MAG: ATP synthase A1, C subunit [uncultured archaeon A07HB70]|nr:MAG: ATP synthase A1, C subunit [uncultured archaeon A07HB70]